MQMGTIIRHRAARYTASLLLAAGAVLASPTEAQQRRSIAIMPTQYFTADAQSAENVTQGLVRQFESNGYNVMPMDQSRSAFQAMGLSLNQHYPDEVALQFGRRMGADLVAYPRLLTMGIPVAGPRDATDPWRAPAAVLHLRVLNARTGMPVYFRQIAHRYEADQFAGPAFSLPQPVALAAADAVTDRYFARVAGSREEIGIRR